MLTSNQQMIADTLAFLADEPPVIVDWLPWHHTFGGNHNFGLTLYNGGTLYIDDGKPTPAAFGESLKNLAEISPTVYFNVPRGFEELAAALERDRALASRFFSRVKVLFYAAAGLSQGTWDKLERLAEETCGERIVMLTGLGMTETAPFALCANWRAGRSGAVGLPAPGVELRLEPVGHKLEARYRGPSVTPGFWRAEALNRQAFDADGYYCSGDAVSFADPQRPDRGLLFDGRLAEDFKLDSGTWVSVGPLRTRVIAAATPYVRDAVVTGQDRPTLGLLLVPDVEACRQLTAELAADAPVSAVLSHAAIRRYFLDLLRRLAQDSTGSATRIDRALLLMEPLSIDRGEITDKGSVVQQAVLRNRAVLVDRLYAPDTSNERHEVFKLSP
jgi:feruloyl-CoA synthase